MHWFKKIISFTTRKLEINLNYILTLALQNASSLAIPPLIHNNNVMKAYKMFKGQQLTIDFQYVCRRKR